VGKTKISVGPDNTMPYVTDWTGRFRGITNMVLHPGTVAELSAVLNFCNTHHLPIVPQGGNTGLVGGGVPLSGETVVTTRNLKSVREINLDTGTVVVEAGVTLSELDSLMVGWESGVRIASRETATVGGAIATNAGGLRVLKHGSMRAHVLGVEAVLADGSVVSHLAGLVKDNTGYDYAQLFCGSEGTLGIISAARLQLRRIPEQLTTIVVGCQNLAECYKFAETMRNGKIGHLLYSAEFMGGEGLELLVTHLGVKKPFNTSYPFYLLFEYATAANMVAPLIAAMNPSDAVVVDDARQRRMLWELRERYPEIGGILGVPLKMDVSVPPQQWVALHRLLEIAVKNVDLQSQLLMFGHILDGNIHVNVVSEQCDTNIMMSAVFDVVVSLDGSISAEHGIGTLKKPWLNLCRTPSEIVLFEQLRAAFDPKRICNPNVLC